MDPLLLEPVVIQLIFFVIFIFFRTLLFAVQQLPIKGIQWKTVFVHKNSRQIKREEY